jgi:hypothetical protein
MNIFWTCTPVVRFYVCIYECMFTLIAFFMYIYMEVNIFTLIYILSIYMYMYINSLPNNILLHTNIIYICIHVHKVIIYIHIHIHIRIQWFELDTYRKL